MFKLKGNYKIDDLVEIMTLLRSENGCPWDREQTHESIRMNLLEEVYEVMEAIDEKDISSIKEELGDLLLQVVFHSELGRESGNFNFDDVCDGICKKLIYRHPHVFGNLSVNNSDEVLKNWDELKSKSKEENSLSDRLKNIPKLLPSLMRGEKVGKRASNLGIDFISTDEVTVELKKNLKELEYAIFNKNDAEIEEKFGDILFTCCSLGRFLKKDNEKALTSAINKFIMRFEAVELYANVQEKELNKLSRDELRVLWEKVKTGNPN